MARERGNWTSWFEFLFSCIGSMVGLGNIWRFPYLCYKNGGGAFLIPYFLFMMVCALPLVCIEMAVAQFANLGPGKSWILCPLFKGVGLGMVIVTTIVSIYYNVIIAWAVYYLAMSFSSELPWSSCGHEWNTPHCYIRGGSNLILNTTNATVTGHLNRTSLSNSNSSDTYSATSVIGNFTNITRRTPTEEFWEFKVLMRSDSINELGVVRWELLLCLMAAWITAFLCFIKGIKTSGKVMYVAATLPYLILLILLIRGLFLPGSIDGLRYYLIPQWEKLLQRSVWSEAAIQVFFSAGIAFGTIPTLSSYNRFHNNCLRDGLLIPFLDGLTSWFAGMVIFVTLGYMAYQSDLDIQDVVAQGPGIAFMVYPEALAQLPLPQLWCVFFFLLLFTVGMDSQIVHMQTITTAIFDNFPRLADRTILVNALTSIPLFAMGIVCVTQGGIYVLKLLDWYCASIAIMPLAIMETVVLSYIYGVDRIYDDIELMTGSRPMFIWKIMWLGICPLFTLILWVSSLEGMTEVKHAGKSYPIWAVALGWIVAIIPLIPVPIGMASTLRNIKGSWRKRFRKALRPTPDWGPADKTLKELYYKRHIENSLSDEESASSVGLKPML